MFHLRFVSVACVDAYDDDDDDDDNEDDQGTCGRPRSRGEFDSPVVSAVVDGGGPAWSDKCLARINDGRADGNGGRQLGAPVEPSASQLVYA
uniref:Secreted protein n=1 Tax=Plectus sambesii TaxID=2011161 RepID=A0A914V4N7_9BILA